MKPAPRLMPFAERLPDTSRQCCCGRLEPSEDDGVEDVPRYRGMTMGDVHAPNTTAGADWVEAFKALGNPVRLQILQWLREPDIHFAAYEPIADRIEVGVCVSHLQAKTGLAQSTVSAYMTSLEQAGLVQSTRVGKWTHYRRDEARIQQLVASLGHDL